MPMQGLLVFIVTILLLPAPVYLQTPNPFQDVVDPHELLTQYHRERIKHAGLIFGEMEMFLDLSILEKVYHMDEYRGRPGYIIFNDRASIKASDGEKVEILCGFPTLLGYKNGLGQTARFESVIRSFVYLNDTHIVIADTNNYCLRLLNLVNKMVSVYAGVCTVKEFHANYRLKAKFRLPTYLAEGRQTSLKCLFILDRESSAIRYLKFSDEFVYTMIRNDDELHAMSGLELDTVVSNTMLVKSSYYIKRVNIATYNVKVQTIFSATSRARQNHILDRDGPLAEAYFSGICDITAIAKNVYIQTGHYSSGRLRVIDLEKRGVSSICKDSPGIHFKGGPITECCLPAPYSVALIGTHIYVGASTYIARLRLKRECKEDPPIASFARVTLDEGWRANYQCNDGYKEQGGDRVLYCEFRKGWVGRLLQCVKVVCKSFPATPVNGKWEGSLTKVDLVCNNNYVHKTGDKTLLCKSGSWKGVIPTCAEIECKQFPALPVNGRWDGNFVEVKLVCNPSHSYSTGDKILRCVAGKWVGKIPTCTEDDDTVIECSTPPPTVSNGIWKGNKTVVTIECAEGFKVTSGNETMICPVDQWLGVLPLCQQNDTYAEALESESTCPYSLEWIGLTLSCGDTLVVIGVVASVLSSFLLCFFIGAFRRRSTVTRHRHTERIIQHAPSASRTLTVNLHNKPGSKGSYIKPRAHR